jgi:hypothetical protein
MERFNLKKLNEVKGKEQYHAEIWNRYASLENLVAEVDINKEIYPNHLILYQKILKRK